MAKVFTLPFGIQRFLANPSSTCNYMVFVIITSDASSTIVVRGGKTTRGHWCKMFHNQITSGKGHVPLTSIQDQVVKKLLLCLIKLFVRICTRKYVVIPRWHITFLHELSTMTYISKFLNNDQRFASNQLWMCIFNMGLHGSDPINLTIFDKAFSQNRLLAQIYFANNAP